MKGIFIPTVAGLLLVSGFIHTAFACEIYDNQLRKYTREYNQFEKLVLLPLQQQKTGLEKDLDREINGPVRLMDRIQDWEGENRRAEKSISELQGQVARLDERLGKLRTEMEALDERMEEARAEGKKKLLNKLRSDREALVKNGKETRQNMREKRRDLGRLEGQIDDRLGKIARARETRESILTMPPSASELEEGLRLLREKLKDERELKREKEGEVKYAEKALQQCREYRDMKDSFRLYREAVVKIRAYGCDALSSPAPAQRDALEDMNCNGASR